MSARRGARSVDFGEIDACVERAIRLLRLTYRGGSGGGGWYHRLDADRPGPSATAAGVAAFLLFGREFDRLPEAMAFLRQRQIDSPDRTRDGGWAVNTSQGQPVTEATALVPFVLYRAGLAFFPGGPDFRRACSWLIANQNEDGGWGSRRGQPSRVWLTAMALRTMTALEPYDAGVRSAVEWLLRSRDTEARAWGELPGGSSTVTHTAYVLTALTEFRATHRRDDVADAIAAGYAWLAEHIVTDQLHGDDARTEEYNVSWTGEGGSPVTWQSTVWHSGLPYALSALTRAPQHPRMDLIAECVQTMLVNQQPDGRWPSGDSAASRSIWTVWPFLEALSDVRRLVPSGATDVVRVLSPDALLVHRRPDQGRPVVLLLARAVAGEAGRRVARWGASIVLVVMVVLGGVLVGADVLAWREYALSLILPIVLLIVQLVAVRRSDSR